MEPPVAIEVPAPDEPTSDERRHHGHTFSVSTLVQHLCPSSRESEIKAEVPLQNDISSHQNLLLQQYEEKSNCFHKKTK